MLRTFEKRVLNGTRLAKKDAIALCGTAGQDLFELLGAANRIRNSYRGSSIDLCSIVNAKSGGCAEDCAYCAQSASNSAGIAAFPLLETEVVLQRAREAGEAGAKRFCIVTGGRRVAPKELSRIGEMVGGVREAGLLPCATLGLLSREELLFLRDSGLERYHHNLETSERYFPAICSTHSYADKMKTIEAVLSTGLSLCSGGIFGLGESWQDRLDMAFSLGEIGPDSVPINFLIPIKGTPLESRRPLDPLEALKVIAIYRMILPDREIRVCGGRMQTLGEFNSFVFFSGADGLLIGNYLTTPGRDAAEDISLIKRHGLSHG